MIVETGSEAEFKRSLIYGHGETIRLALNRMNDRWLRVQFWSEAKGCPVSVDMDCDLPPHNAMLHIGTYVLRYGLSFDLTARVKCNGSRGHFSEERVWTFDKAPARTGPAGESLPALSGEASLRVRQMDFSANKPGAGSRSDRPVSRGSADAAARRAAPLPGFGL